MRRALTGVLTLLGASGVFAETRGAAFLRVPVDARSAALGEIGSVGVEGPAALYTNPAGLGRARAPAAHFAHAFYFDNTRLDSLAFHWPTLRGAFGIGTRWLTGPDLERVANDVSLGRFSAQERTLELGASTGRAGWSLGASGRMYQSILDGRSVSAGLFDLGVLKFWKQGKYQFGAAFQHLGSDFGDPSGSPPTVGRAGLGAQVLPSLWAAAERYLPSGAPPETHAALEFRPAESLALRTGYVHEDGGRHPDSDTLSRFRLGLGLRVGDWDLDYAFSPKETLGELHRLSLIKKFPGWAQPETVGRVTMESLPSHFSPNSDGRNDRVFFLFGTEGVAPVVRWRVDLRNSQGLRIRRYEGPGSSPGLLEWNGTDARERELPDGEYTLHGRAWSDNRQAFSAAASVVLDRLPPEVSVTLSTGVLTAGATLHIRLRAKDRGGLGAWKLSIRRLNDRREVFQAAGLFQGANTEVEWNGIADGAPVPNGHYEVQASAEDAAGNPASVPRMSLWVDRTEHPVIEPIMGRWNLEKHSEGYSLFASTHQALGETALARDVARLALYWPDSRIVIRGSSSIGRKELDRQDQGESWAWSFYRRLRAEGVAASRMKAEAGSLNKNGLEILFLSPANP